MAKMIIDETGNAKYDWSDCTLEEATTLGLYYHEFKDDATRDLYIVLVMVLTKWRPHERG